MIGSIIAITLGAVGLAFAVASLYGDKYVIVLLLTNGDRKPIPATRLSIPTTSEIAKIEEATRTPENPRGAFVYGWYRVKR